jgi:hypothetical protein
MRVIVYTVCTANYLAQARSMCDSVISHNPGYECIIGLADRLDGRVRPEKYSPHRIIEAESIEASDFEGMAGRYNALELSCALKSFFGSYILKTYSPDKLIFLDSDILVFHSLDFIEARLGESSILLTPHIFSPYPDSEGRPKERDILKTGIYNGGFFALRNDENANAFLNWWMESMKDQCYERPRDGMHADQNWLNLVPLFFEQVEILRHPGCNVAYWNFHERTISKKGEGFIVNGEWPLLFFHYSGHSINNPLEISRHQDRFDMKDMPAVKELFRAYHEALSKNGHNDMLPLEYAYAKNSFGKKLKKIWKGN